MTIKRDKPQFAREYSSFLSLYALVCIYGSRARIYTVCLRVGMYIRTMVFFSSRILYICACGKVNARDVSWAFNGEGEVECATERVNLSKWGWMHDAERAARLEL